MSVPSPKPQNSYHIHIEENDLAQQLFGPHHEHVTKLEECLGVSIHVRGGHLQIEGDSHAAQLAQKILNQLYALLKQGMPVYREDIDRAIKVLSADYDADLSEVFKESIYIPAKKKVIMPRSQNQRSYLEAMKKNDLVFAIGPAGTGKTYLAVATAVHFLLTKQVSRIILSRPAVEAGERLGFLPGDIAEKINPYLRPLYDALYDMLDYDKCMHLMETGVIEVAPLAFMRGRTLNSAFIILDEAQNCTSDQMKMMLTRIGFGSRAVVAGDVTQTDLPDGAAFGLLDAERRLKGIDGIAFQYFNEGDVVRHELVTRIVVAYDKD